MQLVSVMVRKLNDGVDYGEFRKGWIPDEVVPGDPRTRVITAANMENPQEIVTIAIIEGDHGPESVQEWMERLAPVEERRFERIKDMVGPPSLNAVYQVLAEDDLSKPIAE
ncbi:MULTISPECIES: hypothetical protein [Streptomycetaceae]|uniref:hypothetical protein n=1 Tax=Streptomycetaceae TaxID=2062 RepID=UPI000CDBCAB8|nr:MULTISPECIES: hypothetical protein [Streptomycetaceae]AUY53420.1 hypothetical protein C2142_36125 [Streptomyces sp. CB01881]MBP0450510.1 hypothetical protein [Kitasatospora sp. RG8]TYC69574.1 hypothetical protein EH183_36185 [Streptomyces sp. CB01881]